MYYIRTSGVKGKTKKGIFLYVLLAVLYVVHFYQTRNVKNRVSRKPEEVCVLIITVVVQRGKESGGHWPSRTKYAA